MLIQNSLLIVTIPAGEDARAPSQGRVPAYQTQESTPYIYEYDTAGRISSIRAPGNETLYFSYDGPLQLQDKWQGSINGAENIVYNFDKDGCPLAPQERQELQEISGLIMLQFSKTPQ